MRVSLGCLRGEGFQTYKLPVAGLKGCHFTKTAGAIEALLFTLSRIRMVSASSVAGEPAPAPALHARSLSPGRAEVNPFWSSGTGTNN